MLNKKKHNKIGIIGLGYVGLPLALKFSEKHQVVGLDLSKNRIIELKKGIDVNKEIRRFKLQNNRL